MANFQHTPNNIDPLISESLYTASTNFRIDNLDYKFYVYLYNGDGKYLGLTSDAIELLNIKDNILDIASSGTCIIRNENDVIERSNYNSQLNQQDNYFARQPKTTTVVDEFFFRNDCRDYLVVYIQPQINNLTSDENIKSIAPISTLFYLFSIIENEDIIDPNNNTIKFKKLSLVDTDLEVLREKRLFFSYAKLVDLEEGANLAHLDDDARGAYTGDIIKNLIINGLDSGGSGEKTAKMDR